MPAIAASLSQSTPDFLIWRDFKPILMNGQRAFATIEKPSGTFELSSDCSPASLNRSVSPPPFNLHRVRKPTSEAENSTVKSDTARIEAGEVEITDHVSFFSTKLLTATRPPSENQPRLPHPAWLALYHRNLHDQGHHFIVHQHDHPIAGTHYDLRLQCNSNSSISFAIPYGLPGDPNSRRLNRNAIETRVHNLWNHLIETASHETGTMLLWDSGEYEVLPYNSSRKDGGTDTTTSAGSDTETDADDGVSGKRESEPEPQKLHRAFQSRKIKLRLHGTRLPKNYTINLRLLRDENLISQPEPPGSKRRRKTNKSESSTPSRSRRKSRPEDMETSSDSSRAPTPAPILSAASQHNSPSVGLAANPSGHFPSVTQSSSFDSLDPSPKRKKSSSPKLSRSVSSLIRTASPPPSQRSNTVAQPHGSLPSRNLKLAPPQIPPRSQPISSSPTNPIPTEESQTHLTNAYPGALNTIHSIHQRKWLLSLDRLACGFRPTDQTSFGRKVWERPPLVGGEQPIHQGFDSLSKQRWGGFEPFHVLGRGVETSILTGRLAGEVARDEGLVGYKPRGGWRGITD